MLSFDLSDTTHWADLLSAFGARLSAIDEAADVEAILQLTMTKTLHLLRLVASDWNQGHDTFRNVLSPEVWASCFSFLSLDDCIHASHVSRSWRSTALAFPRLWSQINLPLKPSNTRLGRATTRRASPRVLSMAISRACQCPLDISITGEGVDFSLGESADVLCQHMHHIRSLSLIEVPPDLLAQPAPLLEDLAIADCSAIPEDLCGGTQGRLRRLKLDYLWLPAACPALCTITHLTAGLAPSWLHHESHGPTLKLLFELMPRLESLALSGLTLMNHVFLPSGPAPPTLRTLAIEGNGFDLAKFVAAWKTESLRDITITTLLKEFIKCDSRALFEGALTLEVDVKSRLRLRVSSLHNGPNGTSGTTCTLIFGDATEGINRMWDAMWPIIHNREELAGLRDFAGPAALLCAFYFFHRDPPPATSLFGQLQCLRPSARLRHNPSSGAATDADGALEPELITLLKNASGHGISLIEISIESAIPFLPADAGRIVTEVVACVQNRCEVVVRGIPSAVTQHADVGFNRITFVET